MTDRSSSFARAFALSLLIHVLCATSRSSAASLPEDALWEGLTAPSTHALIRRFVVFDGKLVVTAGNVAAGQCCTNVWSWDGSEFTPLPKLNGSIDVLGVWQGRLVAASVYTGPTREIMVLNGAQWDTLGTTNNQVNAIRDFGGPGRATTNRDSRS